MWKIYLKSQIMIRNDIGARGLETEAVGDVVPPSANGLNTPGRQAVCWVAEGSTHGSWFSISSSGEESD